MVAFSNNRIPQSSSTRLLVAAFVAHGCFRQRSSPSQSSAPGRLRQHSPLSQPSGTRLPVTAPVGHGWFCAWRGDVRLSTAFSSFRFCRLPTLGLPLRSQSFQHSISPSSRNRSPFGSTPYTRPPFANLHLFAAFSNRVPRGSHSPVASRTRPLWEHHIRFSQSLRTCLTAHGCLWQLLPYPSPPHAAAFCQLSTL